MRLDHEVLEPARYLMGEYGSAPYMSYGAFQLQGPCGEALRIIAHDGITDTQPGERGWEHVSVSTRRRTPNWQEMCFVKRLFWAPDECVVQYHPPETDYVNNHPYVLHMWRCIDRPFPMPPKELV